MNKPVFADFSVPLVVKARATPNFDKIDSAVEDYAKENAIPQTGVAAAKTANIVTLPEPAASTKPRKEKGQRKPAPERRMALNVPDYVLQQIRDKAAKGQAARYQVMISLKKNGYNINPEDLVEDRRRES
jgi:hypothetical protein